MLTINTSSYFQSEKEYVFFVLLREMLGLEYVVEYQSVHEHILRLPNGATIQLEDWFPFFDSPLPTFQNKFSESWLTNPQFPKSPVFPFPDIFAATFCMLTRWEETVLAKRDAHGRFPANQSIAWKQGFLHRPIVNEWADGLWELLVSLGWHGERKQRKFQISLSCDVDHPRLWWSAPDRVKTLAGAFFKRGDTKEAAYWLKNHIFSSKDPYDVFDEWLDFFEQNNIVAQFNFMGERPGSSDCWYPLRHPFIKNVMTKLVEHGHKIGFHPSYESFENQDIFNQELASLREVSPIEIVAGRQHYLRFSVPKTWQMWEAAGLKEDSTLGYPEAEGFRCGICHDFPVYDKEQRKMLQLREKPLVAMDVTLAQYRRYTPEEAADHLFKLRQTVEKHGGDFTLLWHNSSWNTSYWEAWKSVFRDFLTH